MIVIYYADLNALLEYKLLLLKGIYIEILMGLKTKIERMINIKFVFRKRNEKQKIFFLFPS